MTIPEHGHPSRLLRRLFDAVNGPKARSNANLSSEDELSPCNGSCGRAELPLAPPVFETAIYFSSYRIQEYDCLEWTSIGGDGMPVCVGRKPHSRRPSTRGEPWARSLPPSPRVRENGAFPALPVWPNREAGWPRADNQVFPDEEGTGRRMPFCRPSP